VNRSWILELNSRKLDLSSKGDGKRLRPKS
jgi:hypothetical protein